jgi:hypothetical protein
VLHRVAHDAPPLYFRLFTSYFLENLGYLFFEKTAGGPGLTVQSFYATDGAFPVIAGRDVSKFALIAFKNPEKYIGKPLQRFTGRIYEKF